MVALQGSRIVMQEFDAGGSCCQAIAGLLLCGLQGRGAYLTSAGWYSMRQEVRPSLCSQDCQLETLQGCKA